MNMKELKKRLMKKPEFARAYYEQQWDIAFKASSALEFARIKKGWSQKTLADKMGSHQSNIARAENGIKAPTLYTLNDAAKSMGMVVEVTFVPKKTIKQLREG